MLHTKKILATLALLSLSLSAFAAETWTWTVWTWTTAWTWVVAPTSAPVVTTTIDGIDFVDSKTLTVKLSNTLTWISNDSEWKVLEDLWVVSSLKDVDNSKKIKVQLSNDLVDGTDYSLISISEGLDTSMDFNLSGDKSKIMNSNLSKDEVWIDHISVVDPRNIEVYLNKDSSLTKFEFKMFKELKVESMFLDTNNLNLKLTNDLLSTKDYILILTLKDLENKDIEIENSLYDFSTPDFGTQAPVVPETTPVPAEWTSTWVLTWSGEATWTWAPIADVAMNAKQTPDTWAKTNVLLILTFILSLSIFAIRRKSFKA